MGRKVLIATRTFGKYSRKPVEFLKSHGFDLTFAKDIEELERNISNVDALIVGGMKIDRNILHRAEKMRIVAKHGVGYDNIDVKSATEKGIVVVTARGTNSESVAELVIGFIFALSRLLIHAHNDLHRNGKWNDWVGQEVRGKTLGVIGFGDIGKRVAEKGHALGMSILVTDPYVQAVPKWIEKVELNELLQKSDFVSLHVPLNESTRGMLGKFEFSRMKNRAFLINTSRGEIVDEEALVDAIENGEIAGAALDVFKEEPLPSSSPILNCERIIITPHIGSHTYEAVERMGMNVAESIVLFFEGKTPSNLVNPEALRGEKR